jgi:hypothetical protein
MKSFVELVRPLGRLVDGLLLETLGEQLSDESGPPLKRSEFKERDPMWRQVSLAALKGAAMMRPLQSVIEGARSSGQHTVPLADVLCAICAHVVDTAVANRTLVLPDVRSLAATPAVSARQERCDWLGATGVHVQMLPNQACAVVLAAAGTDWCGHFQERLILH